MKGIYYFLTFDSNKAKYLRNSFIFKIICTMNPDGEW